MGIFDFLTGRNPTSDWVVNQRFKLLADLSEPSLCGVPLEGRYDLLEGLGPSENPKEAKQGNLIYYSRGLEFGFDLEEQTLDHFRLIWNDDRFRPWEGTCLLAGREISLTTETTPEDAIALFGEPDHRDEDPEGLGLEFERNDVSIEIDFTLDNRLWSVSIW